MAEKRREENSEITMERGERRGEGREENEIMRRMEVNRDRKERTGREYEGKGGEGRP